MPENEASIRVAIAVAYRDHRDGLRRVAVAQLYGAGLIDEADDVVQNAVAEVFEKPPAGVRNWEAFLVRVVQRRALDFIGSAPARRRSAAEIDPDAFPNVSDPIEAVGENLDAVAAVQRATDALGTLDPAMAYVARECLWKRRTQSDVAGDLGVSQPRVNQLLKEARKILAERIGGGS